MPSVEEIGDWQAESMADDVELDEEQLSSMCKWSEAQIRDFFESGGEDVPLGWEHLFDKASTTPGQGHVEAPVAELASLQVDMREKLAAQMASGEASEMADDATCGISTVDGWVPRSVCSAAPTIPYADLAAGTEAVGEEFVDDLDGDGLSDGEERCEDALLDDPMASVPVTHFPPGATSSTDAASTTASEATTARGDDDDGLARWSVRQLKEFLAHRGVDTKGLAEKQELVDAVRQQQAAGAAQGGDPRAGADSSAAAPQQGEPSAKLARLTRKVEDIKKSGDGAFRDKDFEKANRHYSSALQRAAESGQPLPGALLSALFSNRSSARLALNLHAEALEDGKMALKHRPGWARAHSRIGAALIALRQLDEARANYELGLQADPGSRELQGGLADVLSRLGKGAGGSEAAAAAKARGNEAFKAGRLDEAHAAYSEAMRGAPTDETLYSNRSAALARLERYDEALADAKRAVSLQPGWGKAYSRAGLAALKGGDEEAAYWFYANGLKHDPRNAELLKGRGATLQALYALASRRNRARVARFKRDAARAPARVFAISDVHYDHPGAKEWAASLSKTAYQQDALIIAGDVGDTYTAVRYCLKAFRACFRRVFYVPGNHDMWIRPKGQHSDEPKLFADSVQKLLSLWQLCDELDVDSGPAQLGPGVVVCPLDAWYHYTFDHHDPTPSRTLFDKFCKWPMHYDSVAEFMASLNEARLQIVEAHGPAAAPDVITFSHFLPRQELPLPGVFDFAKGAGCLATERQLRRIKSKMHIFGHTHINTVNEYDGVTYMQNAMGYGIRPGTQLTVVHDAGRFKTYLA